MPSIIELKPSGRIEIKNQIRAICREQDISQIGGWVPVVVEVDTQQFRLGFYCKAIDTLAIATHGDSYSFRESPYLYADHLRIGVKTMDIPSLSHLNVLHNVCEKLGGDGDHAITADAKDELLAAIQFAIKATNDANNVTAYI